MAKPVPGAQAAFEREWMLGRRLNAVAERSAAVNLLIHTGTGGPGAEQCSEGLLILRQMWNAEGDSNGPSQQSRTRDVFQEPV